jgi:uroporphyrin-III C-methyltransferase
MTGTVFFVGAGPGDPGLITVKGLALLRNAQVVLHDRLVSPDLLGYAHPRAEVIDVGKTPGSGRNPQGSINELLVQKARAGKSVVRLKGGDPFLFGRGFEECQACDRAGIPYKVVPGVSSALAVPASAGIPVTHREISRSLAIVTASFMAGTADPLDYDALARIDTVVVLMGRAALPEVARRLMQAGRDRHTPVACIQQGTTPHQRTVVSTLERIAEDARMLESPMLTVIGDVSAFAQTEHALRRTA